MMHETNTFDPLNWPAPMPNMEYGLYHYRCECPTCGESFWSDKGMRNPERRYRLHWWVRHEPTMQNWSA